MLLRILSLSFSQALIRFQSGKLLFEDRPSFQQYCCFTSLFDIIHYGKSELRINVFNDNAQRVFMERTQSLFDPNNDKNRPVIVSMISNLKLENISTLSKASCSCFYRRSQRAKHVRENEWICTQQLRNLILLFPLWHRMFMILKQKS